MLIAFTKEEREYMDFSKDGTERIHEDCPPEIRASIEKKFAYDKEWMEERRRLEKEVASQR